MDYKTFMNDKRYQLMKERFMTLSREQLLAMRRNIDITLFDDYNYQDGKYCPMAIALDLHNTVQNPTHELIKEEIGKHYVPSNMLKGVEGEFYHGSDEQRKADLLKLIDECLLSKFVSNYKNMIMPAGNLAQAVEDSYNEVVRAKETYKTNFTSSHEGYAVLLEEVDELWDEVKKNPRKMEGGQEEHRRLMRKEAIQVAAMALRFISELTPKNNG
jgi:hypothetical protein